MRQKESELHRLLSEPVLRADSDVPITDYGSCSQGSILRRVGTCDRDVSSVIAQLCESLLVLALFSPSAFGKTLMFIQPYRI